MLTARGGARRGVMTEKLKDSDIDQAIIDEYEIGETLGTGHFSKVCQHRRRADLTSGRRDSGQPTATGVCVCGLAPHSGAPPRLSPLIPPVPVIYFITKLRSRSRRLR